ncbi:hypothetical protein FXN61_01555 [Lentzea sp. PSKA42]|uniref:DUF3558 domain-containing protein n=1 Tax=Lentzea indica TaxID=2604800 RepID=A0ABX1F9U5_9PSEU|nr:hypothetical protein [Lentzea indica]NKE55579.1 hypothetical protein [Lentzea indica]
MRPVICMMATAMVLVGGCSAKRVETPTFGPTPTVITTPFPSVPTGPVAPAKYTKAALKSCLDIKQEMGGDLPPPEPEKDQDLGSRSSSRSCIFRAPEHSVVLGIQSWSNTDDATGIRAGPDYAAKDFAEHSKTWEKASGVNLGSDARWRAKHPTACGLEVLDENAVLSVIRNSSTAIDEEQCRGSVRELAQKFYAAVQP